MGWGVGGGHSRGNDIYLIIIFLNLKKKFNLSRNSILNRNSLVGNFFLSNNNKNVWYICSPFQSWNMCNCLFGWRRLPGTYIRQVPSYLPCIPYWTMYVISINPWDSAWKFAFYFVILSIFDQLENHLLNHFILLYVRLCSVISNSPLLKYQYP